VPEGRRPPNWVFTSAVATQTFSGLRLEALWVETQQGASGTTPAISGCPARTEPSGTPCAPASIERKGQDEPISGRRDHRHSSPCSHSQAGLLVVAARWDREDQRGTAVPCRLNHSRGRRPSLVSALATPDATIGLDVQLLGPHRPRAERTDRLVVERRDATIA
jgi:hypothetical protein